MHLPHATFSHEQSLHSTDDMCAWLKFELRPKRGFSSTRHVSLCASQVLNSSTSPTPDLLFTHPFTHERIHGRMALPRNSTLPQVMSPKGSSSTGPCFNLSNQRFDCHDGIEEIGVKQLSYSQSLIHSTIRQRAWQRHWTRTSKTNKYVRCWLHHCIPEVSGKLDAESVQKREAKCSQRTQSLSLKTRNLDDKFFSRSLSFQGNLMQCFPATLNWVRTRSPKETKVTNRETGFENKCSFCF